MKCHSLYRQKHKIHYKLPPMKIEESAVQMNDRYMRFSDIFLSTRHKSILELNLIGRFLRRSDTVCRQVLKL